MVASTPRGRSRVQTPSTLWIGCGPSLLPAEGMGNLTVANQLTILRIILVPVFVLLVVYNYLGWALLVFLAAGATDALDGLIARLTGQRTTIGAWLDPM